MTAGSFGLPGLEELHDARETADDVLVVFFSTGFFARASPGCHVSPSATMRCDGIGSA